MQKYQTDFLNLAIATKALCFGEFTLKSGRNSPYFFNSGLFYSGNSLAQLGQAYAHAIMQSGLAFDGLYGPAYKGIPLVAAVAIALNDHCNLNVPYTFNRKEVKDHGEGGMLVGAPLKGKVLIIDDVISAGTSVRESISIIKQHNAIPAAVAISLDRQEKGTGDTSAIQEVEKNYGLTVINIVCLQDMVDYLSTTDNMTELLDRIKIYRQQYGA